MMHFMFMFFYLTLGLAESFDWQGHRGARGLYPENTINGMKKALTFKQLTTLELDVVISKDGQVVVSHEPWMSEEICLDPQGKSVTDRKYNLYQMTYDEIAKFDCGSKVHPRFPLQKKNREFKPKLSDLLETIEKELLKQHKRRIRYNIEIKSLSEYEKDGFQPEFRSFSDMVVKVIQTRLTNDRFMIQSFDWRVLKYIHEKYPQITLAALREDPYQSQEVIKELGFIPAVFSPDFKLLRKEDVVFFKQKGIRVIPWTVNTAEDMLKIKHLGVDGLITDYPNLILGF